MNKVRATVNESSIGEFIWDFKYRWSTFDGEPLDQTVEDTWERVARDLASVEQDCSYWHTEIYNALSDFKLVPGGRILAGAGTSRKLTLVNTFVMGDLRDDLDHIFYALKESALTMSHGGGIGIDFSTIRPKGAEIKSRACGSSGPIPFMEMWDQMCTTIMSGGLKRGAMMAMMRCDHPDIEEFIQAKSQMGRMRRFNLSVLVTDPFMKAVENDSTWELVYGGVVHRRLKARQLWETILREAYEYSEPGVIFIDQMNHFNKLGYCEKLIGVNSCGEQPLPAYGSCPLASVNLAKLVESPFTSSARLSLSKLEQVVATGIRLLDNVIDITSYPLEAQAREAFAKRRIGLGITGLADALAMENLRYGSEAAIQRITEWMTVFRRASYLASSEIAREKGSFPLLRKVRYLASPVFEDIEEEIVRTVRKDGIRNGILNTVAPNGTGSLYSNNISSGIEPIFSLDVVRRIERDDGSASEIKIRDYAYDLYVRTHGPNAELTDSFVTAAALLPRDHVLVQATVQRFIDASISKTINCPKDISFEELEGVYTLAYRTSCKGCTIYRPSEVRSHVLKAEEN